MATLKVKFLKNYLIAGLGCLIAMLIIGVEPVIRFTNEAINRGTLRGVERCMDYEQSAPLSKEAVKTFCAQSFQIQMYLPELASGKAGPRVEQDSVRWEGRLENKTADHVATWVKIVVVIFDKDGKEQESYAETPIWIDPTGEAEFTLEYPDLKPDQFDDLEFCGDNNTPKKCFAWSIAEVKGLKI